MSGAIAIRVSEGGTRSRGPAFLPAAIAPEPQGSLYQNLYKKLRDFILDGVWTPGTRLPSSRALAADLKVSRNTAILAVEQLIADGWAEARSRSGVYVAASPALVRPLAPPSRTVEAELPPFALQRPATDLFPAQIWKQLQGRAWAEIEPHRLAAADPAGDAGLRDAIARLICAPRGLRCHPDQVMIVPSATAAIDLIVAALLCPGETAMVEAPCRPSTRRLLEARGAVVQPVVLSPGGRGEHALVPPRDARLACVSPAVQYPHGSALCATSRAQLVRWSRMTGSWIIEDDRDADLAQAEASLPLAAEDSERVILAGSFNRILFPGLCVAFLVAPALLADRLRSLHAMIGGRASLASQLALRAFIAEGHFARHVRRRRQAYADRRAALAEALGAAGLRVDVSGQAGLHLVIEVADAEAIAARLAAAGLGGVALEGGRQLALGLGGTVDAIRADAPRVAAAIAETLSNVQGDS